MADHQIKNVIAYWAQGEITSFIKVWLSAYISLTYCYFSGKILAGGISRLACFLPVVCLFLFLPLQLKSMHLGGITAFFLAWLTNFKLLMFAFNTGPLANPSLSYPRFLAVACLPIKLIQQSTHKKSEEKETPTPKNGHRSTKNYAMKGLLMAFIIRAYSFDEYIHPGIILVIYCFHIYFALEIILAIAAAMARVLLGAELEPQFDEPYLSTSLQDFWGRRWNLMVTRMLRPTVYVPVRRWSTGIIGRQWAPLPAVMLTFVVSGLMHELIFFYLGRVKPTWEITLFFLLHGVCLNVEIAVKKVVNGRWQLPRVLGTILTVGFVMVTGFWLFFPPLLRCGGDVRGLAELSAVGAFVRDIVRVVGFAVNSRV
ncbi:hypothetical protein F511_13252 [Dorcoceras hygrometricum]|uniref:Wax synthase domain-containing protein n=1 Tax=Dorcoceras hygrometricum TaxID=472368 RepID=A0A2Z7A3R8_9LAMI|nr:hypothetical protein F511_13252 [Dorcoceras hygrometricum]